MMQELTVDVGVYTPISVDLSGFDANGVERVLLTMKNDLAPQTPVAVQRALTGTDVVLITPEESLRLKDGARFDLTAQRTDGRLYRLGATGAVRLRRGVGQQWQTP